MNLLILIIIFQVSQMIFGEIKIVDLISLLVILLSILASTWRGFLKEFLTITIWIISYFLSTILFKYVISYSKNFIQIEVLANLISWIYTICHFCNNFIHSK